MTDEGRTKSRLVIQWIGDDCPADGARRMLDGADTVLGGPSTPASAGRFPGLEVVVEARTPMALAQTTEAISARRPVPVSGGDPLFYGVALDLCDDLGKVVPRFGTTRHDLARTEATRARVCPAGRPLEAVDGRTRAACDRLRSVGALIVNAATTESCASSHGVMKRPGRGGWSWNVTIARGREQFETLRFAAVSASSLLAVTRAWPAGA